MSRDGSFGFFLWGDMGTVRLTFFLLHKLVMGKLYTIEDIKAIIEKNYMLNLLGKDKSGYMGFISFDI